MTIDLPPIPWTGAAVQARAVDAAMRSEAAAIVEHRVVERGRDFLEQPACERRIEFLWRRGSDQLTKLDRRQRQVNGASAIAVENALRVGGGVDNTIRLAPIGIHAECVHNHSV